MAYAPLSSGHARSNDAGWLVWPDAIASRAEPPARCPRARHQHLRPAAPAPL